MAPRHGLLALALLCAGCGMDAPIAGGEAPVGFDENARAELSAIGVDRYFGKFSPSEVTELENGETTYTFAPDDDGPVCIYGDPYRVSVRDAPSNDLLIYLQGGGACWSDICSAKATAGFGIMTIGWTDGDPEQNPLGNFDVVFANYCDGSVFSGDNVIHAPDGSIERRHRGLANLTAALEVARERFPEPDRIVLAGSSAGGYGTILGTAVVRLAYPTTRLFVINDAGLGLTNPDDPSILDGALNEWKVGQLVPPSCEGCIESGQFTSVIDWGLAHDPTLRVGVYSSYEDFVIGGIFLGMEGPAFRELVLEETGKLHSDHPKRFQRFLVNGSSHTAVIGYYDATVEGVRLVDWVEAMISDDPAWQDLTE